ncbi:hypothetical protein KC19_3G003600 [Ceratodon purpureus]|uniref:Uncharacterized protein n=1 Tax=Ceratodon purpureus TaxID=3225 RepID=A0A8T0IGY9_CERPU|nr:hypothetical protein KC19_3G003600 [Ceratodon purpureus]
MGAKIQVAWGRSPDGVVIEVRMEIRLCKTDREVGAWHGFGQLEVVGDEEGQQRPPGMTTTGIGGLEVVSWWTGGAKSTRGESRSRLGVWREGPAQAGRDTAANTRRGAAAGLRTRRRLSRGAVKGRGGGVTTACGAWPGRARDSPPRRRQCGGAAQRPEGSTRAGQGARSLGQVGGSEGGGVLQRVTATALAVARTRHPQRKCESAGAGRWIEGASARRRLDGVTDRGPARRRQPRGVSTTPGGLGAQSGQVLQTRGEQSRRWRGIGRVTTAASAAIGTSHRQQ